MGQSHAINKERHTKPGVAPVETARETHARKKPNSEKRKQKKQVSFRSSLYSFGKANKKKPPTN